MATKKFNALMGLTAGIAPDREKDDTHSKPRSAPGQMMGLSTQRDEALDRAEKAEGELKQLLESGATGEIALDQLHEVAGRKRSLSADQFNDLRENLRSNKLVQAITVKPRMGGGYEIISGHNRVAAYRELGKSKILAVIDHDTNASRADIDAFFANLLQPDLPDYEKYLGFDMIRKSMPGTSQTEIAALAGISKQQLSRLFAFADLPAEAHALLVANPSLVGANAAESFSDIARSGKAAAVVDAISKMAAGEMDGAQAVRFAAAANEQQNAQVKPAVELHKIKSGKKTFCDYRRTDKVIRLSFKDSAEASRVEAAILAVLKSEANLSK